MTQETEDVVILSASCGHHFKDDCQSCQSAKTMNDTRLQSLSDRIDVLEAEKANIPEGVAFFKALKHGAAFKWMELVQAGASQARLDAQSDLQILLVAVAKKVEEIEEMDSASLRTTHRG